MKITRRLVGALMAEGWLQAPGQTRLRLAGHLQDGRLALSASARMGEVLGADEGGLVPVERAEVAVLFGKGRGLLESATFQAGPLLLKSNGYFTGSGAMRLSLRFYLGQGHGDGPAIAARGLSPFLRLTGTDWFYRDFVVEGTAGAPLIGPVGDREVIPVQEFIEAFSSGSNRGDPVADVRWRPVSESIME